MSKKKVQNSQCHLNPAPAEKTSRSQFFTYAESKLLDQMTFEISEAWREDIDKMRGNYCKVTDSVEEIRENVRLINQLTDQLVNNSIQIQEVLDKFRDYNSKDELKRLEKSIDSLSEEIKKQSIEIMSIQMNNKRSFWKRLFKR